MKAQRLQLVSLLLLLTCGLLMGAATKLDLTTQVSGVLPLANGGTGTTTGDVPSGMIAFINSGTCPTGWTQQSYSGDYLLMTVAANSDVGGTGGSTSYTPAGTNGTTTTGATSAGTPAGTNGTTTIAVTGTKMTTSGSGTAAATTVGSVTVSTSSQNVTVPAETFTGSAMATHTHTVPAETFAGTAATIQPPYVKLIPCQKN